MSIGCGGMEYENCFLSFYFNYFFIHGEIRIWFIQDENMFKDLIVLKGKSCQKPIRRLVKTHTSWWIEKGYTQQRNNNK